MHNGLTNEITFTHQENNFILYPLSPSQVIEDQVQMKKKEEKITKIEKVIQQEENIKNTFENMILVEQPSNFVKGTLRKIPKEVNKYLEQKRKHLERKILYSSLNFCEKLPKEKQEKWQHSKNDFQTNTFALFDDSQRWTFDPGGQA